jgi:SOS-response transcriptional repressor LexA
MTKVNRSTVSASFVLAVKGDSMAPKFQDGDRIVVDPEVKPRPGDFVVAKLNGHDDDLTFMKYGPRGTGPTGEEVFELAPLNTAYAIIQSDRLRCQIVGTVIEHHENLT